MSVPAEKLTNAFTSVQENLEAQIEMYKHINELSDKQLESANNIIKEMESKSKLQDDLIESLSAMNDRYEILLKQRDDFIQSLKF